MSALENTFHMAIFDQFLESFARIPRSQQKKVTAFIRKFRADPTSPSINYERIHSFADPNLRTVRIGDDYRAIVLRPEDGNVFVLLWVDHHDEAMEWARRKRVEVHPETGSLQVYSLEASAAPAPRPVEIVEAASPEPPEPAPEPSLHPIPLFAVWSDADLFSLGVPGPLLPVVRGLSSEQALDELSGTLPAEAWEALSFLAAGEPIEEVRRALEIPSVGEKDVSDLAAALSTDASKRSFVVVENDDVLASMLDAPLERWRVFLHPSQRRLVERSWSGPVRVLGGAGTGKTVVAMHRAAWLLQHSFMAEDDRVLFTTFTRNLAADIQANLAKLLAPAELRRVEVIHLDKWVADFLNGRGYRYEIDYFQSGSGRLWTLWQQAMDLAAGLPFASSFYREEWEYVVQAQGCRNDEDYLHARRRGRGVRLSRGDRRAIWRVFQEYQALLEEKRLRESTDAMRDAAALLERREAVLGYRSVIVDEAQDMSTVAFQLLRQIIPQQRENDLFIVGDGHQRIYRRQVVLSQAGVNVVGRSRRLRINYRTTDEIRRFAVAMLEGLTVDDLDEGADTTQGYRSLVHGVAPQVVVASTLSAEVDAIASFIARDDVSRTCLVARTGPLVDTYTRALEERGLKVYRLRRSAAEDHREPGLRVATMHRVKGLEFDRVIVAGAARGVIPLALAIDSTDDPAVKENLERQERALLYVAVTRARREVLISAAGHPSPWIEGFAPPWK